VEGSDILQTLAEVSIALTGFSGIVMALHDRAESQLSALGSVRFRILLAGSLAALLLSLLPFLLYHLDVAAPRIWSTGSVVVVIYMVPIIVWDARTFSRHATELPALERRAGPLIGLLGLSLWLSQLANVFHFRDFGIYLAAPMWFLAFSAFSFVRLLFELRNGPSRAERT
jgi:hypothetical protein